MENNMRTSTKVIVGIGVLGGIVGSIFLLTKRSGAAPPEPPEDGFVFSLTNTPEDAVLWIANLGTFNFNPAGSGQMAIGDYWVYQGTYNGAPSWSVSCYVTVTVFNSIPETILQKSRTMLIENGQSYVFDCAT
jgi:hypothetical protein